MHGLSWGDDQSSNQDGPGANKGGDARRQIAKHQEERGTLIWGLVSIACHALGISEYPGCVAR
ncbi:hypothetical protein GCM10011504_51680 [Siccirubricoccus deserti]|nr:hypothetical protein GCM10011504_51680 [Siccirubricoccus deserti]